MTQKTEFTVAELNGLPPTLGLEAAAQLLGIGRTNAYAMARTGKFPVPVLHLGKRFRVPTVPVLRLLGVDLPSAETPSPDR